MTHPNKGVHNNVLTGGDAIVQALLANGVDTLFGLPGAQMYPLFDALKRNEDRIRTIGARHEQGSAYAAFGYARSTGRPGVFSVVPGPGVLNAMAALCTAMGCNAPVLCVTGQIPSPFIGKGRGHLHELRYQLGTLRSVIKWAERIERPADAADIINEAFRQMLSGRPGPVAVEMAWDVMASSEPCATAERAVIEYPGPAFGDDIDKAVELIRQARRPMIVLGSGAQHAAAKINALAEAIDAPATSLRGGRGIVAEDSELGVSCYAAKLLWPDTDLVIGIGTRLELPYMRWTGMMTLVDAPTSPPLIRIDIDPEEMARLKPAVGIVADSAIGATALVENLADRRADPAARRRIANAKSEAAKDIQAVTPHAQYLDVIRSALPRDGILVEELCQAGFTSYFGYPVCEPRTYISAGFQGTLGFGFPSALGVKVAHPKRPVVSITGDGGFMFGVQELATAAQERIGVVTILFNNNAYGNVARDQETAFQGRTIGSELKNPDFIALAQSFGVHAVRVGSPDELRLELPLALSRDEPVLIEVIVDRATEVSPWSFLIQR